MTSLRGEAQAKKGGRGRGGRKRGRGKGIPLEGTTAPSSNDKEQHEEERENEKEGTENEEKNMEEKGKAKEKVKEEEGNKGSDSVALDYLPLEMLFLIFNQLLFPDLYVASQVCQLWRTVALVCIDFYFLLLETF